MYTFVYTLSSKRARQQGVWREICVKASRPGPEQASGIAASAPEGRVIAAHFAMANKNANSGSETT